MRNSKKANALGKSEEWEAEEMRVKEEQKASLTRPCRDTGFSSEWETSADFEHEQIYILKGLDQMLWLE